MAYLVQTVVTKFIFLSLIFSLITAPVLSLPFVVFNGFLSTCNDAEELIETLEKDSGNQGQCISLGGWLPRLYSAFTPIMDQVKLACEKVKELDELKNGYNLIGISQGSMISRGLIEFCDEAPPIKNFISLGGPQAGIATAPNCTGDICEKIRYLAATLPIYSDDQQVNLTYG
ncbi:uncharacterized protein LOC141594260 [Silene latifolia]|uniref:uncharacterized protein LOC141594260 n=1 Tax=Silene latifolia TaxID=37657 RepID=UPI003D76D2AC